MLYQFAKTVLFIFVTSISMHNPANELELSDYRWENRILLLFSGDRASDDLREQINELLADKTGLKDRDMLVFSITPQAETHELLYGSEYDASDHLWEKYDITTAGFHVILIGKDGTVKLRDNSPVTSKKLYAIIDAMPMRQAEMRRKN